MDTPKHSVSVAAVITDDSGRALLIQRRDNGKWEPPGGVLELGETIEDGLRREVREETGLDIEPGPLTGVYKNMVRGVVALVFSCKVRGGALKLNTEVKAFHWARPAEISRFASEAYAARIIDALRSQSEATVRHHDGQNII